MLLIREALDGYEHCRRPQASYVEAVAAVLPGLRRLWKALGLHKPRIVPCILNGAGTYINGSCQDPIILLDVQCHLEYDDIKEGIKSSIVHELIHAYLDSQGLDCGIHDEDFVEEAARDYCYTENLEILMDALNTELRKAA
jgi:hypothetical protein